jgi:flavodoxin
MHAIVIYYSETGNTEKVARAIARALQVEAKRVEDVNPQDLVNFDLICLGTPVQNWSAAKTINQFIDAMPVLSGKKAAVFCTAHIDYGSKTIALMGKLLEEKGLIFQGGYFCKGRSRLVANFGPRIFNRVRPNTKDLLRAEEFARKLVPE